MCQQSPGPYDTCDEALDACRSSCRDTFNQCSSVVTIPGLCSESLSECRAECSDERETCVERDSFTDGSDSESDSSSNFGVSNMVWSMVNKMIICI